MYILIQLRIHILRNLANESNFFTKNQYDQIWLPSLYYPNTEQNVNILSGDLLKVQVLKKGEPEYNSKLELNEGRLFKGDENPLELSSKDKLDFTCHFDLSWFPFDTQSCSIFIRIPTEMESYLTFKKGTVMYKGKYV